MSPLPSTRSCWKRIDGKWPVCRLPRRHAHAGARLAGDGEFAGLDPQGLFPVPLCVLPRRRGRANRLPRGKRPDHPRGHLDIRTATRERYEVSNDRFRPPWRAGRWAAETIRWTSRDGTEIEGVLRKPAGFDPSTHTPRLSGTAGRPGSRPRSSWRRRAITRRQFANKGVGPEAQLPRLHRARPGLWS
jgi:hypothetical protein